MLRRLRSCYARSNSIIWKFHNCSIGVKLHVFHAYCTIYCSQLKSTCLKLKVAYSNTHRQILGYNSWDSAICMFANNSINNFDALLKRIFMVLENGFMTLKIIL